MQLTNIFAGLLLGAAMSTSVLASPAPKDNTVAMAENIRRALAFPHETNGMEKRSCNCRGMRSCENGCSAFGGTAGSQIAWGFCLLQCAPANGCSDHDSTTCPN